MTIGEELGPCGRREIEVRHGIELARCNVSHWLGTGVARTTAWLNDGALIAPVRRLLTRSHGSWWAAHSGGCAPIRGGRWRRCARCARVAG